MSRFQFIADEYPEIFELCSEAEKNKYVKIDFSMLKARQALKQIVVKATPDYNENDLFNHITYIADNDFALEEEIQAMHKLRRISNHAVHGEKYQRMKLKKH